MGECTCAGLVWWCSNSRGCASMHRAASGLAAQRLCSRDGALDRARRMARTERVAARRPRRLCPRTECRRNAKKLSEVQGRLFRFEMKPDKRLGLARVPQKRPANGRTPNISIPDSLARAILWLRPANRDPYWLAFHTPKPEQPFSRCHETFRKQARSRLLDIGQMGVGHVGFPRKSLSRVLFGPPAGNSK